MLTPVNETKRWTSSMVLRDTRKNSESSSVEVDLPSYTVSDRVRGCGTAQSIKLNPHNNAQFLKIRKILHNTE